MLDPKYEGITHEFQSAPGPKAGITAFTFDTTTESETFQSAPGPKAGITVQVDGRAVLDGHVSIRSRPEGRDNLSPS